MPPSFTTNVVKFPKSAWPRRTRRTPAPKGGGFSVPGNELCSKDYQSGASSMRFLRMVPFRSIILLIAVLALDYFYLFGNLARLAPGQEHLLYVVTGFAVAFVIMDILLPKIRKRNV